MANNTPVFPAAQTFNERLQVAKRTVNPEVALDWDIVQSDVGVMPQPLDDEQLRQLSTEELEKRWLYFVKLTAYLMAVPSTAVCYEKRWLYNVSANLTGDLSGLWGDARGITGRVNPGTTGNVTGLVGPMDNIYGDVSRVWGTIHRGLYGTVSAICGDLTNKTGYCSDVMGDVSQLRGDLTPFVGDVTGLSGTAERFRRNPRLLSDLPSDQMVWLVTRRLENFIVGKHSGDWSRCWGDASGVEGRNEGLIGDVSDRSGNVTGQRGDTAFLGAAPPKFRVVQTVTAFGEDGQGDHQSAA
ncbi:MAG: hypothetical protein PHT12_00170 [Patescibacteria group bacterium]|nr:hypothetical protein [Patescibacteria group bacterium]